MQQYACPTHKAGNTIDLMFTNNSDLIHNIESFPSSVSDHLLVNTTTTHKLRIQGKYEMMNDEKACDYPVWKLIDSKIERYLFTNTGKQWCIHGPQSIQSFSLIICRYNAECIVTI